MTEQLALGDALSALAGLAPADAADTARIDQHRRWTAGERVPVESYLDALPAVAADPEQALVLIYGEVLARTAAGEVPTLDEYRDRFPQWAERLAVQFQLHAALDPPSDATSADPDSTRPPESTNPRHGDDPDVPDFIGPYRVLGELGRGGMGVVYEARDSHLEREVAIKTLRGRGDSAGEARRRFLRESRITAKLPHPSIPPVYELGEQPDGTPYLAMKLIRGRTLADLLRDSPDDRPRFVQVFEQVCHAVGFAHSQGVLHRDLKPANVMVGRFGEVQVMDWGLARSGAANELPGDDDSTPAGADETRKGTVLGTPAYMPPEQARGEPADARSDVFALGALLTEILTGRPAFTGPDARTILAKAADGDVSEAVARLRTSGADAELVGLTERCLSPVAADRPANGTAVAEAVAAHRAGVETRLRTAERATAAAEAQALEQQKRRRVQLALAGVVFLLLSAGGGFAWWQQKLAADGEIARIKTEAEQGERRQRAANGIERAIAQATELRGRGLWRQAEQALGQGESFAAEAGEAPAANLLATARSELGLLRQLDQLRLDLMEVSRENLTPLDYRNRYDRVFRDHGYLVPTSDPVSTATRIAASPLRAELLAALDWWWAMELDKPYAERVKAVAQAVAGPSWRDGLSVVPRRLLAQLEAIPAEQRSPIIWLVFSQQVEHRNGDGVAVLQRALVAYPNDFWLLTFLAITRERRRDYRSASEVYRTLRALRPDGADVCDSLGLMALESMEWKSAADNFLESIRLNRRGLTYSYLGRAYTELRDEQAAVTAMDEAVRLDPENSIIRNNLGASLRRFKRIDEAAAAFQDARRLDPTDPKAPTNLGLLQLRQKKHPTAAIRVLEETRSRGLAKSNADIARLERAMGEALAVARRDADAYIHFKAALAADPADSEAHFLLGELWLRKRDPRAIPELREAVRLAPLVASYHSSLGEALRQHVDFHEALRHLGEAIQLDPGSAVARFRLGWVHSDQGNYAAAETAFADGLRRDGRSLHGHLSMGTLFQRKKDDARAADWFLKALAIDATSVTGHYQLGLALSRLSDWKAAAAAFGETTKLDSRHSEAWFFLGNARYQLRDDEGAVQAMRQAEKLNPTDARTQFFLGVALRRLKKWDEAIVAFNRAGKEDPKMAPEIRRMLDLISKEQVPQRELAPPPRPAGSG